MEKECKGRVWTQEDFVEFTCTCGDPDCPAEDFAIDPPCDTPVNAVYNRPRGELTLTCTCGEGHHRHFSIGGRVQ